MRNARRTTRAWIAAVAALATLLVTAACGSGGSNAATDSGKIRLGYSGSALVISQYPLWLPEALGYWEEEGLDVQVDGFPGNSELLQAVVADRLDVASSTSVPMLDAIAKNQPVQAYFNIYTGSMFGLAVPVDSDIQDIADLKGKTIGVSSMTDGQVPQITAQMAQAGFEESDYSIVAIGRGEEAGAFLKNGRVDVIGLWDSQFYILDELGFELRQLDAPLVSDTGFGYGLSTRTSAIQDRSEDLVGLARGVAKATVFAKENPEAAAELFFEMFPEALPAGEDREVAIKREAGQLALRLKIVEPVDGVYGLESDEKIEDLIQLFTDAGVISADLSVDDVFNESLLKKINEFDEDEVVQRARSM
jgi:NitT/TauT family transport system substrate-binding protein